MRQLLVYSPRGSGPQVLKIADKYGAKNLAFTAAQGIDRDWDVSFICYPNNELDSLVENLEEEIMPVHFTIVPQGVLPLSPPRSEVSQQAQDVSPLAPLEVFLSGLQSIGSWKGFLGYSSAAGIVVWIGLYTNTIFLLTAAMLIAPFAGPAMELALGTSRGDTVLVKRSVLRYFASITVSIVWAFTLSLIMGQDIATDLMVENSLVSGVSFLLPLVAGAAGALNLCQSERNSLVSGAATGMLVAASLAPPAGVIGMAMALQEWHMVKSGLFVLLLQLFGINISGACVFWLYGLAPKGVRYSRGRNWVRQVSLGATLVGLSLLLWWQFSSQPELQRSSISREAEEIVKQAIEASGLAQPVETSVRFTRPDIQGREALLIFSYVKRENQIASTAAEIKTSLEKQIIFEIKNKNFNVNPLIEVTVLEAK